MESIPSTLPKTTPSLEATLISTLQQNTVYEIVESENKSLRMMLIEIQAATTMQTAVKAPKIFQLRQTLGERDLLKLVSFILKSFADSVKVKEKLSNVDIIEAANLFIEKYTHDSVKDLILALKLAKVEGFQFYNCLSQETFFLILEAYFARKSQFLENEHRDLKTREASQQAAILQSVTQYNPPLARQLARMIPDNHPNRNLLREKLTLDALKKRRGIQSSQEYPIAYGKRKYLLEPTLSECRKARLSLPCDCSE